MICILCGQHDLPVQAPINFDSKANLRKAWIGFNAAFDMCLLFAGTLNVYIAFSYPGLLQGFSLMAIATIGCTFFLVCISHVFLIRKLRTAFLIAWLLFRHRFV